MKRKVKKSKVKKLKKPVKVKPRLINLKVPNADLALIAKKAKKFAGGNVSLWLRHAGINYVPRSKDLA